MMQTRQPMIYIVDDEPDVRAALKLLMRAAGYSAQTFDSPLEFLDAVDSAQPGCLLLDVRMPGMSGLELQEELARRDQHIPIIFISGHGDIPMAVRAVHGGAVDFLEKPFSDDALLAAIDQALARDAQERARVADIADIKARLDELTPREHDVLRLLLEGNVNKIVARELGMSVRTVEIHRARVLAKMGVSNVSQLVRLVVGSGVLTGSSSAI